MKQTGIEVELRKIDNVDSGYLALVKKFGTGVFFAHIRDDVYGAVALNQFLEMLRSQDNVHPITIKLTDKKVEIKSSFLLEVLKKEDKTVEFTV